MQIHRLIKAIQTRDGITYDQACERLYREQFQRLKCSDEDSKAWSHLVGSVNIAITGARDHKKQDP